jgi:hypothetical protein
MGEDDPFDKGVDESVLLIKMQVPHRERKLKLLFAVD